MTSQPASSSGTRKNSDADIPVIGVYLTEPNQHGRELNSLREWGNMLGVGVSVFAFRASYSSNKVASMDDFRRWVEKYEAVLFLLSEETAAEDYMPYLTICREMSRKIIVADLPNLSNFLS